MKAYFSGESQGGAVTAITESTPEGAISYYTDAGVGPVPQKSGSSFHCQGHTQAFSPTDDCSAIRAELAAIY